VSEAREQSRKSVLAALAANSAIAVIKLIAAVISGSTALLAEGFHSIADTGNQALLLLGLRLSDKPPDEEHPFGHGKERFFWTFVVALALFLVGGLVSIERGVSGLLHPEKLPSVPIAVAVLVVAAVFEGSALRIALRTFNKERGRRSFWGGIRRAKDPETLTVVFEDTAALTGIVVAIVGIVLAKVLDDARWDSGAAVIIGLLLCGVAFALAREVKDLLIGESAKPETRQAMRRRSAACPRSRASGTCSRCTSGPTRSSSTSTSASRTGWTPTASRRRSCAWRTRSGRRPRTSARSSSSPPSPAVPGASPRAPGCAPR
jgi:cation diffusion facilitator family transporter